MGEWEFRLASVESLFDEQIQMFRIQNEQLKAEVEQLKSEESYSTNGESIFESTGRKNRSSSSNCDSRKSCTKKLCRANANWAQTQWIVLGSSSLQPSADSLLRN